MQRFKRILFWTWLATGAVMLLLVGFSQLVTPGKEYAVKDGDLPSHLGGRWAWTSSTKGCESDHHVITFAPDRSTMTIAKLAQGADTGWTATYDVLKITPSRIRGAIRGEKRKTDDGKPVVWDLVMFSEDEYRWHRTDWRDDGYTGAVQRCKDGEKR